MDRERLVEAVRFNPPGARERYDAWRAENAETLAELLPEQIRVDTGRADGGDFVRVWLPDETPVASGVIAEHSRSQRSSFRIGCQASDDETCARKAS
jgi:hypothetical protein